MKIIVTSFIVITILLLSVLLLNDNTFDEPFVDDNKLCNPVHVWDVNDGSITQHDPGLVEEYMLLNILTRKTQLLIEQLKHKYPNDKRTKLICKKWNGVLYRLEPGSSDEAAVTYDKKEVHICLRDKENGKLNTPNASMFVLIHELAHIATESIGHGPDFWSNMRFLLYVAENTRDEKDPHNYYKVYLDQKFENTPITYCGHKISGSPLTCVKKKLCDM